MAGTAKSGWGRKLGVVGLVLSWGVACTQLFGDGRENTLAPMSSRPNLPTAGAPAAPGAPGVIAVCGAGEVRCEGALLQVCSDDGSGWVTKQRCAAAALCQANPATCLAATCSTDEMTCSGSVLQKCNADRTGWDLFATCLSPAHCNAGQRQCMPEPCTPGERRCDRSEADQSPVLEVCREDRQDWGPLDGCATRELCDQTLTSGSAGGLVLGTDGIPQVQAPSTPSTVVSCLLPACAVGETRCEGARLEFCSEGRTGWNVAEECASAALCEASLAATGLGGAPQCLPPACNVGQHQCTPEGVLQVCSDDRTRFVDQEACIGAPFCNAAVADRGERGCLDAPCEAGQMQCNGAQILVCRDDRTALDPVGEPCESAALCNADDPTNAFCEDPVCHRGPNNADEFRCDGAQLQRCSESLTNYDTVQTCVTPELCDASQRGNGCNTPACQPGQHACNGGFLQTCNAGQTAFENTENCGSQAQCDANAGRCSDPCEIGSKRCNATNGDLEQCNDLLTGWQPIADCANAQLCDLPNGRCDICLGGQFSCADNQLRQCSPDGGTFARQNIGPECAPLPNNAGVGVRTCQNNAVVVTPCPNGCANGVCFQCVPNTSECVNGNQIRRCNPDGTFGATTSCADSNACDGAETCNAQTNSCTATGNQLNCNDNNRCTNDSCNPNPGGGCVFSAVANSQQCAANGLLQRCVNGQPADIQCNQQLGCLQNQCAVCGQGQCNGNQFVACVNGQFAAAVNCTPDNNACTNDVCTPQGCQRPAVPNGTSCADNNACNGNETCQNGNCAGGAPRNCNDNNACTNDSCNAQNGNCQNTPVQCAAGSSCNPANGQCQPNQICTPNSVTCTGNTRSVCNAAGTARTNTNCPLGCNGTNCLVQTCTPNSATCANTTTRSVCNAQGTGTANQACAAGQSCTNGQCVVNQICTPNSATCANTTTRSVCNAAGTARNNVACAAGQSCTNGQCVADQICTPNSATCANTTTRSVCNAAGTARNNVACAAGQTCANGVCSTPPPPRVCTPGTTCVGSTRTVCNAAGTASSSTTCTLGCVTGGTTCRTCTPGTSTCAGNVLSVCNAAGTAQTVTDCGIDVCRPGSTACIRIQ